jgi:hypothetical protein
VLLYLLGLLFFKFLLTKFQHGHYASTQAVRDRVVADITERLAQAGGGGPKSPAEVDKEKSIMSFLSDKKADAFSISGLVGSSDAEVKQVGSNVGLSAEACTLLCAAVEIAEKTLYKVGSITSSPPTYPFPSTPSPQSLAPPVLFQAHTLDANFPPPLTFSVIILV